MGQDPLLVDPENGDYRPAPGSPAADYGCQTFPREGYRLPNEDPEPDAARGAREARGVRGSISVAGTIYMDTVWDADTVRVTGELQVNGGVTLTILPPARIEFEGHDALSVMGRILAVGTPEKRITFTSAHPEEFVADTTTAGGWAGIRFPNTLSAMGWSRFHYCTIEYCKGVETRPRGGAFYFYNFSKAEIANCTIRNNVAYHGAGVFCSNSASPRITSSLFTENRAFLEASAVQAIDAYPKVSNCTIVGNQILNEESFWSTATIHNHIAKTQVANCILWDNTSHYFIPTELLESKAFYTTCSDIESGYAGAGNIAVEPLFSGDEEHPYRLRSDSPCVDSGTPDAGPLALPALDLFGSIRIYGAGVDMGAYEWIAPSGLADETAGASLLSCFPNPFRSAVVLRIPEWDGGPARITIVDPSGRTIRDLGSRSIPSRQAGVEWDGRDARGRPAAPGVYWMRLEGTDGRAVARRVVRIE